MRKAQTIFSTHYLHDVWPPFTERLFFFVAQCVDHSCSLEHVLQNKMDTRMNVHHPLNYNSPQRWVSHAFNNQNILVGKRPHL